jgi:hypothetical protein
VAAVPTVDPIDCFHESEPPFGSAEKKHEFPDAFALAGVQRWCDDADEKDRHRCDRGGTPRLT